MNRKLFVNFIPKLFFAVACFILPGAMMSGCGKSARAENESGNPTNSARISPELTGKWQKKQAGENEYARYAENLGTFETLEIAADGRVRQETLTVAKIYDCPVEDSSKSEGALIVESETQLNITLDVGTHEHREGCSPTKNYTAPTKAATADFQWKINKTENGATDLCLTDANGETACYIRVEIN